MRRSSNACHGKQSLLPVNNQSASNQQIQLHRAAIRKSIVGLMESRIAIAALDLYLRVAQNQTFDLSHLRLCKDRAAESTYNCMIRSTLIKTMNRDELYSFMAEITGHPYQPRPYRQLELHFKRSGDCLAFQVLLILMTALTHTWFVPQLTTSRRLNAELSLRKRSTGNA